MKQISLNKKTIARGILVLMIIGLSSTALFTERSDAATFGLKCDLGYNGVPFAGGAIVVASNFTNTGQLTIGLTSITLASDFWSNGTRPAASRLPFNLTSGGFKEVDTPLFIPTNASIGSHLLTVTTVWQYSNSSGWYNPSPLSVSKTVVVSQTISSLFSGFVTILLVGLGVAAVAIILIVFLVMRQGKKRKASPAPQ